MEFGILGPLEVRHRGQPVALGGRRQRGLLALFLLHPNEILATERVIEALWGDAPPPTANKMVQTLVSQLRRALASVDGGDRVLVTRPPGYQLRIEPDQLDAERFEALAQRGRDALATDPERASVLFHQALASWRGAPLAEFRDQAFVQVAVARLEELRLHVIENQIDADLALGRHRQLVVDLKDMIAQEPLRERFRAQQMLALYRSGRQAEALNVYRETRAVLVEDLGIDPSTELQSLETAILRHDPALDLPPSPNPGLPSGTAVVVPAVGPEGETAAGARTHRSARRQALVGAAVVAVIATALFGVAISSGNRPPSIAAGPNSISVVDPRSNSIVRVIQVGTDPGPIAIDDDGGVWVANRADRTVQRLDASSLTVVKTFGLSGVPVSVTPGDGVVWIGIGYSGTLARILVLYDQLSAPMFPGPAIDGFVAVATAPSVLWVGLRDDTILRLDAASLRTQVKVPDSDHPQSIVLSDNSLWAIQFSSNDVRRFDPDHGTLRATIPLGHHPQAIAQGGGFIWVATEGDDILWKIDPSNNQVAGSVPIGMVPANVTLGGGAVWVTGRESGTLERVDPATLTIERTLRLGRPIGGSVFGADRLLVTTD